MNRILWLSLLLHVAHLSVAVEAAVLEPSTTRVSCERSGNRYSIVPGTGCTAFVEVKYDQSESVGECPTTSVFDLELCQCTWSDVDTKCVDVSSYASSTKCGAALVGQGQFSSPNYPGLYPSSLTCTWTLTAAPGKAVRLIFQDFEVESGVGCTYDNVKVYNGAAVQKNLVRTACGAALPDDVIGEGVLTVIFSTNTYLQMKGFSATFHSIDGPALPLRNQDGKQSCDADYRGTIGTVASPNYPNAYPNNAHCIYTITVKNKVVLTFAAVNIEYHFSCDRDYLEVRDGNATSKILYKICGKQIPAKITSSGSMLYLKFVSDSSTTGIGFYAMWKDSDLSGIPNDGKWSTSHEVTSTAFWEATTMASGTSLPKVVSSTSTSLGPSNTVPKEDSCTRDGEVYTILAGSGCKRFTLLTTGGVSRISECPPTMLFDVASCYCNYDTLVTCNDDNVSRLQSTASTTTTPVTPSNPVPKDDTCSRDGEAYTILAGSGCKRFTLLTTGGVSRVMECPPSMHFDVNSCYCNYDTLVTCNDDNVSRIQSTTSSPTTTDVTTTPAIEVTTMTSTTVASTRALPKVTCVVNGNIYKPIINSGCKQFTLLAPDGFWVLNCPKGLEFDLNACYCRKPGDFICSSGGQAEAQLNTGAPKTIEMTPPATELPTASTRTPTVALTRAPPKTSCVVNGNIYRSIKGSGCTQYTLLAIDGFWVLDCPKGLAFDVNVCFCRKPADFLCSSESQDQASISTNVPKVTEVSGSAGKTTTLTSLPTVADTKLPPKGSCFAGGNLHSLIKDSGCLRYALHAQDGLSVLDCPKGLAFDIKVCVCRKPSEFNCAPDDQERTQPTTPTTATVPQKSTSSASRSSTATPPKDTCDKDGNTYATLRGTSCTKFVLRAPADDRILDCPSGFAFDLDACGCRYTDDFVCLPGGFDQSSLRTTLQPSTKETSKASHDSPTSVTTEQNAISSSVETTSSKPGDWVTKTTAGKAASATLATTQKGTEMGTLTAGITKTSAERSTQRTSTKETATTVAKTTTLEKTTSPTRSKPTTETATFSETIAQTPSPDIILTSMQTAAAPDYCVASGNVHVLVKQMKCQLYRVRKPDGSERVHKCASDLLFDLGACACRQQHEFVCAD